jgi:cysteine-rich repeat protein
VPNRTVSGDDRCNATCTSDERCGNGVLDPGEVCDDGNTTDGDGCPATCQSLVPGDTTIVITQDGWSVRCLVWTDNVCVHPQARMDCAVCATYTSCDVWHDITTFNNNRTDLNFCAIATGDETVLSVGSEGAAVYVRSQIRLTCPSLN